MTEKSKDVVVERNRQLLLERSNVGIKKYNTPLADAGLSRKQLLQHALEEALDLANYLQAELMRCEYEEDWKLENALVEFQKVNGLDFGVMYSINAHEFKPTHEGFSVEALKRFNTIWIGFAQAKGIELK